MLIILHIVHKYNIHMYDCVCLRPWVSLYIYIYIHMYTYADKHIRYLGRLQQIW